MERGKKRKSMGSAASPNAATASAPKKIRLSAPAADSTDAQLVERAQDLLEQMKTAVDKGGRPVATEFLTVPDRKEMPEYYDFIKLPIAIDTVENKIKHKEYQNLTEVESDLKRMVTNAKTYNDKDSLIFSDAERLRKMLSNYMTKKNPAYKDPNYIAQPTPIASAKPNGATQSAAASPAKASSARAPAKVPKAEISAPAPVKVPVMKGDLSQDELFDLPGFEGLTFQQAQEKLIMEIVKHVEDGLEIYTPFYNLPSRSLTDYYQTIKTPVSLRAVQKRVLGQHGRDKPTGHTDFKSWDAMYDHIAFVWNNAWEYNTEESEIYELATQLKEHFEERLAEAKELVAEPSQPSIKLKMGAASTSSSGPHTVKLKLGGTRSSPGPTPGGKSSTPAPASATKSTTPAPATASSPAPSEATAPRKGSTSGMAVDAEALRRQKEHIAAGVNGQAVAPVQASRQSPAISSKAISTSERSGSVVSPPAVTNGVKSEADHASGSQVHDASISGSMAPPAVRPISGSPHPQPHPSQGAAVPQYQPAPLPPPTGLDRRVREVGKTAADALLSNLSVDTHPSLRLERPFHLDIPASEKLTQQSVTLSLPMSHGYVQLCPTISPDVHKNRPYKLFVTVNGQRISPVPSINGVGIGTHAASSVARGAKVTAALRDGKTSVYEARLGPGVNRVEVEVVAGPGDSREARKRSEPEIEGEKTMVFVNLIQ